MTAPTPRVPNHVLTVRILVDSPNEHESAAHTTWEGEITCNICGRTWKPLYAENWLAFMERNTGYAAGIMAHHRESCRE